MLRNLILFYFQEENKKQRKEAKLVSPTSNKLFEIVVSFERLIS